VSLQRICAYAALILLPCSALNFGVSFSWGDVFLIAAVVLNAGELTQIRWFQIPFLLALPFFLLSTLLDPDATLITSLQTLYLWGLVVPFGWVAFTTIPRRRIAHVLLAVFGVSSLVAIGQTFGYVPEIGTQVVVDYFGGRVHRAAGLTILCNELAAGLTSVVVLLPYVARTTLRVPGLLSLLGGMLATMSKSNILALPGLCYYFWREPHKKQFLALLTLLVVGLAVVYSQTEGLKSTWHLASQAVQRRIELAGTSLERRIEVLRYAMQYTRDCLWLGYGVAGTRGVFLRDTTNTAHIYYLGLVIIAGLPGAALWGIGVGSLLAGLVRRRESIFAMYLVSHLSACLALTVLNLSAQSLPLLVAGAIVGRPAPARSGRLPRTNEGKLRRAA